MSRMRRRDFLKHGMAAAVMLSSTGGLLACRPGAKRNESGSGIQLNQVGYQEPAPKVATVRSSAATSFVVRSAQQRQVLLRGTLSSARDDEASGERVQLADFSALNTPGDYTLEVEGVGSSAPFRVATDVYQHALWLTMRAFTGQRCGCAVDLGGGYAHPPCHLDAGFHGSSGRSGPVHNHGGWHDAGDYGRYVVNSGIATGSLLWAWELFPAPLQKLDLRLPESGGASPDFLTEVRWNIEWMLSLQDADGGVWHKQTSAHFCAFIMPQNDHLPSLIIGTGSAPWKSTGATADLCAVGAIAARCYSSFDAAFAQRCLTAARSAWDWAAKHSAVRFRNPPGISTGEYGDADLNDELLWASAELYRTTSDAQYRSYVEDQIASSGRSITVPDWGSVVALAQWSYALAGRKEQPAQLLDAIHQRTLDRAETLLAQGSRNGFGNTLALSDYIWGSNSVAANHGLLLLIADRFHPDARFRDAAAANLHYLLGRNCWGLSWVTQLGSDPFQHPHHRPSVADGIAAPWPGLLSGGPNAHPGDSTARSLPKRAPMRMYIDDQRAYSLNEVAINWNAPLVFLLAGLNA